MGAAREGVSGARVGRRLASGLFGLFVALASACDAPEVPPEPPEPVAEPEEVPEPPPLDPIVVPLPRENPMPEPSADALPAPPPPDLELAAPTPVPAPVQEVPPAASPSAESARDAVTLDLEALGERLRASEAIGFFSKLALKNDLDDLMEDAVGHHERGRPGLQELEERFDLLVMKVMSLLQDDDPELAREIARSRDDLWALLADVESLERIGGGGNAT
jgi:hypothetical protein